MLALRRKVLGDEHPDTLAAMSNVALSYKELGDLEKAARVEEEVLALQRKVIGDQHPPRV